MSVTGCATFIYATDFYVLELSSAISATFGPNVVHLFSAFFKRRLIFDNILTHELGVSYLVLQGPPLDLYLWWPVLSRTQYIVVLIPAYNLFFELPLVSPLRTHASILLFSRGFFLKVFLIAHLTSGAKRTLVLEHVQSLVFLNGRRVFKGLFRLFSCLMRVVLSCFAGCGCWLLCGLLF